VTINRTAQAASAAVSTVNFVGIERVVMAISFGLPDHSGMLPLFHSRSLRAPMCRSSQKGRIWRKRPKRRLRHITGMLDLKIHDVRRPSIAASVGSGLLRRLRQNGEAATMGRPRLTAISLCHASQRRPPCPPPLANPPVPTLRVKIVTG
jgi:hypothetical protein